VHVDGVPGQPNFPHTSVHVTQSYPFSSTTWLTSLANQSNTSQNVQYFSVCAHVG